MSLIDRNQTEAFTQIVLNASSKTSDSQQAYIAGYAEGHLTSKLIQYHFRNLQNHLKQNLTNGTYYWDSFYVNYAKNQMSYISEKVKANKNSNWWKTAGLLMDQLTGIYHGYNNATKTESLELHDFYLMNLAVEFGELRYLKPSAKNEIDKESDEFHHCTGIIKLTDRCDDVLFAHTTWTNYNQAFLRIAKTYLFAFNVSTTKQRVTFSSYPGLLFSYDDFYLIQNEQNGSKTNLAVLETTFTIFNTTLYTQYLKNDSKCVPTWLRTIMAGMLAMNHMQWVDTFSQEESFTYNNNFLIVDYKALQAAIDGCPYCSGVERKQFILDKSITILYSLEVTPGLSKHLDVTNALVTAGFYISFNVPADKELYNRTGYFEANAQEGDNHFSYENGARMCIAQTRLAKVNNMSALNNFTMYNDYVNDKCQKLDPAQGISGRFDLRTNPPLTRKPSFFGGTDMKSTDLKHSKLFQWNFIVGTTSGGKSNIPKWSFSANKMAVPLGMWDVAPGKMFQIHGLGDYPKPPNTIIIVACIVSPCVIISAALAIWAIVFYRKQEAPPDVEPLIDETESIKNNT